jgi:hypothetical protein
MTLAINSSTGYSGSTASVSLTLSTTVANCIIGVAYADNGYPNTGSITDTAGLTYTFRAAANGGGSQPIEFYYAKASSILTGNVITINYSSSTFVDACAFAISGANFTTPFDSNVGLPYTASSGTVTGVSTTNANDMLLSFYRQSSNSSPTVGSGFTSIYNPAGEYFIAQYQIVSSTQSGLSVGIGGGTTNTDANGGIVDAIQQAASTFNPAWALGSNRVFAGGPH